MLVLGLSGGFNLNAPPFAAPLPVWFFHDSAACVVSEGEVLAAAEEERFKRIKHTNMMPLTAAQACLKAAGLRTAQIDQIAYPFTEEYTDAELNLQYLERPHVPLRRGRALIAECLATKLDHPIDEAMIRFVPHHLAHASAAFFHSGFDSALVAIVDGNGEAESTSIYTADAEGFHLQVAHPPSCSLGHFYSTAIELLGYERFDEYKVMGLAPYGDARVYRRDFENVYALRDAGGYTLDLTDLRSYFLSRGFRPRRRGESFAHHHVDFAAAVQETLETIVLHVLRYWATFTGETKLCLAGGVAHNCSMNGRILTEKLFQRMFVHPAAHDGGAAIGAALQACMVRGDSRPPCTTCFSARS
jgi:predicted NodU family carbamoyl transferase